MMLWQALKRHKLLVFAAVALSFPISCMSGACSAYRRPTELTATERQVVDSGPLPYSVSVVPWTPEIAAQRGQEPGAYARSLTTLLEASHAFRSCGLTTGPDASADLLATSSGQHCNTAIIPLFTILSLGIIPTVFDDEDCEGLVLHPSHSRSSTSAEVEVEVRHKGKVVMGWAAVPLGMLPGWSHGSLREDPRFRERFRLNILRRRADIDRLAAPQ
jgi:hypothetical protein